METTRKGEGHLYQGRFKSFPIQDDEHFYVACRYVERNALRAEIAGLWGRAHSFHSDANTLAANTAQNNRPAKVSELNADRVAQKELAEKVKARGSPPSLTLVAAHEQAEYSGQMAGEKQGAGRLVCSDPERNPFLVYSKTGGNGV